MNTEPKMDYFVNWYIKKNGKEIGQSVNFPYFYLDSPLVTLPSLLREFADNIEEALGNNEKIEDFYIKTEKHLTYVE